MTLLELLQEYHSLISRDHHKDRDCHFTIDRSWEYGELMGYRVVHYGYCHRENDYGISKYLDSYGEAEEHLKNLLTQWIKEEKEAPNYD